jgi:putative hemolysin
MAQLGHLPQLGESVDVEGHRLTVEELDGRRVARVRVAAAPADAPEENADAVVQSRLEQ